MSDLEARLRAIAAAAVLQRVHWDQRPVDVPLARPHRVDVDEVVLRLTDGDWLIVSIVPSATSLRAALRRWARETEEGQVLALILTDDETEASILAEPPERPAGRFSVALLGGQHTLWDQPWPGLADALTEASRRRAPPPQTVLDLLRRAEGQAWPERITPPVTATFEKLVFGLAQAHDLVRLVRGEAQLQLRTGDPVIVLAGTGDPSIDDPALAAAMARMARTMTHTDERPGLIVVDGPGDLSDRVRQVLGDKVRLGRINTVSTAGGVAPADPELQQLVRLAMRWTGPIDLFGLLESGLSRARGRTVDREAASAGDERLGLVRWLLNGVPGARLGWLERRGAELRREQSALRIRWVGPEGGVVEEVLAQWRLASVAARWTGQTVDLLLAGGDSATWDRIRSSLGGAPDGHVFHVDASGSVHTRAGLLGPLRPAARALRRLRKAPSSEQRCTLDELQHDLDRGAESEFRASVVDAAFLDRLSKATPWATRGILAVILIVYVLQLRWDVEGALHEAGGSLLVRMGALTGEGLLPVLTSEPWRLLSSSFLHASWWHIGLNAYALWILGRRLEAMLGPERLILLYVASCLGGSVLHEAVSGGGGGLAVGASTGVLGLLAAQGALTLFKPDLMPSRIRRLLWREAWMNGLLIAAISLLPFVGGVLHLGGALVGFGLVATGLVTLGLRPASAFDSGPTQVISPRWLRPLAAAVGAIAVGAAVAAIVVGEPWNLNSTAGRVKEMSFFDGRLNLPVPGRSSRPPTEEVLPDGSLVVAAGDPLQDGLRVRYTARKVPGADGTTDLEDVAAVYGEGAVGWINTEAGGQVAARLLDLRVPDGKVHQRWIVAIDGVVVELEVEALPDANNTRLGGSWTRLPAGITIGEGWDDDPEHLELQHLRQARIGTMPPTTDPLFVAIALADTDRDQARAKLDPTLAKSPHERARAARLSAVTTGGASVLLAGRALAHARSAERDFLAQQYASALFSDGQFDEAARESDEPLTRSQAFWYAGRDADAAEEASRWHQDVPWEIWTLAAIDQTPEPYATNLAWVDLLLGDAERCADRSRRAAQATASQTARFNAATCALAAGEREAAFVRFDEALERAVALGDRHQLSGVENDLEALVARDVQDADVMLARLQAALPIVGPLAPSDGTPQ